MKTIFVSIASYRDKLLLATLNSLRQNESGRNKIVYGVFEQTKKEDSLETKAPELLDNAVIRYKRIDPEYADGVVWARAINAMQHYDEEFFYQIDSHMLFDKDWDNTLLWDYQQASRLANNPKVILTTGTKNFEYFSNYITKHILTRDVTVNFKYWQFDKELCLKVHGPWIAATDTVVPGIHTIAGNFFAPATWIKDVGFNTRLFFEYEEQYMSLTSILAGYKIYHQRKIQCYHYLDSAKSTTRQENDPVRPSKIFDNKKREKEEFINYIYSLGEEKLEEYRRLTGVDYINRKLEERAITRTVPPTIPVDWELPQPPEPAKDEEKNEP
jgi:hypothetical protein